MYERIEDPGHALAVEYRQGCGSCVVAYDRLCEALDDALESERTVLSAVEFRGGPVPVVVTEDFEDRLTDMLAARDEAVTEQRAHDRATRAMRRVA